MQDVIFRTPVTHYLRGEKCVEYCHILALHLTSLLHHDAANVVSITRDV